MPGLQRDAAAAARNRPEQPASSSESSSDPSPAAQEPGMPLVPLLRPLLEGSSCVGTQQAIASQRGITPPQNLITLQMLMQRAGVPVQVRRN